MIAKVFNVSGKFGKPILFNHLSLYNIIERILRLIFVFSIDLTAVCNLKFASHMPHITSSIQTKENF